MGKGWNWPVYTQEPILYAYCQLLLKFHYGLQYSLEEFSSFAQQ